jgi:hypothetical protein
MNKRTSFLTFLLLICLLVSTLGLQAAATSAAALQSAQATAKAPVTIPFELVNRHVVLKGKVNGKPLTFVLDTGDHANNLPGPQAKTIRSLGGAGAETTGQIGRVSELKKLCTKSLLRSDSSLLCELCVSLCTLR